MENDGGGRGEMQRSPPSESGNSLWREHDPERKAGKTTEFRSKSDSWEAQNAFTLTPIPD